MVDVLRLSGGGGKAGSTLSVFGGVGSMFGGGEEGEGAPDPPMVEVLWLSGGGGWPNPCSMVPDPCMVLATEQEARPPLSACRGGLAPPPERGAR
jgi:hypothetical protein